MELTRQALESKLNEEIPLTRAMGLRVSRLSPDAVCLSAPLANNINHKSTAFGGSLYSIAVLAGWCLIYSQLQARGCEGHIVIQASDIQYLRPVTADLLASCRIEDQAGLDKFIRTFRKRKVARIMLNTIIQQDDHVCVRFQGSYVVHS